MIGRLNNQQSLVDMIHEYRKPVNTNLDRIDDLINWKKIERILQRSYKSTNNGRPSCDVVMMFKCMILQSWYNLSDPGLEDAINDRLSFQRFLNLNACDSVPDETTFWRFRERQEHSGFLVKSFDEINRQLKQLGLIVGNGTMIDATIKKSFYKRPRTDRNSGEKKPSVDEGASFTVKRKRIYFGSKLHISTDADSNLIQRMDFSPAHEHDTHYFEKLLTGYEKRVYADKGYASRERREKLKELNVEDCIMEKGYRNKPLTRLQKDRNKTISKVRSRVELVFAMLVKDFNYRRTRYKRMYRNRAQAILLCITYNLKRSVELTR